MFGISGSIDGLADNLAAGMVVAAGTQARLVTTRRDQLLFTFTGSELLPYAIELVAKYEKKVDSLVKRLDDLRDRSERFLEDRREKNRIEEARIAAGGKYNPWRLFGDDNPYWRVTMNLDIDLMSLRGELAKIRALVLGFSREPDRPHQLTSGDIVWFRVEKNV